jgi:hypothetical protein
MLKLLVGWALLWLGRAWLVCIDILLIAGSLMILMLSFRDKILPNNRLNSDFNRLEYD